MFYKFIERLLIKILLSKPMSIETPAMHEYAVQEKQPFSGEGEGGGGGGLGATTTSSHLITV